eukprot:4822484-Pyramimonas_sp.AAC.1
MERVMKPPRPRPQAEERIHVAESDLSPSWVWRRGRSEREGGEWQVPGRVLPGGNALAGDAAARHSAERRMLQ